MRNFVDLGANLAVDAITFSPCLSKPSPHSSLSNHHTDSFRMLEFIPENPNAYVSHNHTLFAFEISNKVLRNIMIATQSRRHIRLMNTSQSNHKPSNQLQQWRSISDFCHSHGKNWSIWCDKEEILLVFYNIHRFTCSCRFISINSIKHN